MTTLAGEPADLARLAAGKPLVVNMWATWCPPCRRELPTLAAAQKQEAGVRFVFADQGEDARTVQRYLSAASLELDNVVLDAGARMGREVGSGGLPTTLFYDANGRLVDTHVGQLTAGSLASKLDRLRSRAASPTRSKSPMMKKAVVQFAVLFALLGMTLGAQAKDWPAPIKALESQGVEVIGTFAAPGGLIGYAGMIEQHPLAIYLTADGKHAIVGTLIDAKGKNLSREPLDRLVSKPMTGKICGLSSLAPCPGCRRASARSRSLRRSRRRCRHAAVGRVNSLAGSGVLR